MSAEDAAKVNPEKESKVDAKEARKAQRLAEEQARLQAKAAAAAAFVHMFGKAPLIQSTTYNTMSFVEVSTLTPADSGKTVLVRARLHTSRKKGKMAFAVLRQGSATIQCLAMVNDQIPKEMVDFMGSVSLESIVDVEAVVTVPEQPITSTTMSQLELSVSKFHVVSESLPSLPFTLDDAARKETDEGIKINFDTRLACRWLEMRTKASNAIWRIQSRVGQYFRNFLIDNDFVEIHSPKLIATASEGGANVFKLDYFGRQAYLAQSPQLYKQMAVQGDLKRVFEVGSVFRAENSNTHRHLTEFIGLDVEMAINEHYYEVLDVAEGLFQYMFTHLATLKVELEAVREQYPFEDFVFQMPPSKVKELGVGLVDEKVPSTDEYQAFVRNGTIRMLRIPYSGAIALLNTVLDEKLSPIDDINTTNEKRLGVLIKQRYGVDFFISDRFPSTVRPFYTMPCPDDIRFTNSYDMFIRGEEISSGAQRIHDADLLLKRAAELKVDLTPIKDYVDSFRLGAWPHGGFGVGLERVVMLYLGLGNIRLTSLFPRDPQRVTP